MAPRSAGSRFAVVLGLGALVVLVTLLSSWRSIALEYHLRRLRNDSAYFFDVLEEPGQGPRREALRRFLELSDGKERLFLAFLNEVLGFQGHQLSWSFGGDHGPGSLNESSMGLLWIGPKTGGLQPAGENLATHILVKSREGEDAWKIHVVEGEHLRRSKAIDAALGTLQGEEFFHEEYPSFRFKMLPGDKAVEAYDHHDWYETPPDAGKTVCLAYRPDEPARTAPTAARRERSRQVGN